MTELVRNKWIEISYSKGLALEYSTSSYFDNRHRLYIAFGLIKVFLNLPIFSKREPSCEYPSYGFYFFDKQFVLCVGLKTIHFRLPWDNVWVRSSYLKKDGSWLHDTEKNRRLGNHVNHWEEEYKELLWTETHPYEYVLKSGEVQKVEATIRVDERAWKRFWLMWLPFTYVIKSLSVSFSEEVGERRGSWKGGTIGCGWDLLPDEKPEACLRRMEKERKFT